MVPSTDPHTCQRSLLRGMGVDYPWVRYQLDMLSCLSVWGILLAIRFIYSLVFLQAVELF